MQNLVSGAVAKSKRHPIWNAKSLRGYALPSTLLDGQGVLLNSANKLVNAPVVPHAIEGLVLSNTVATPTTRIDISAGLCNTTIGANYSVSLVSSLTKALDASWVQGSNSGGRFTSVALSNTTYHVFLIYNPVTNVVDAGFDTSLIAANRPSGWSARRIGSIIREGNSILGFVQAGNRFLLKTVKIDLDSVLVPEVDTLYTLTVPKGLSVITESMVSSGLAAFGVAASLEIRSPAKFSRAASGTPGIAGHSGVVGSFYVGNFGSCTCWIRFLTNSLGQLTFRYSYDTNYYLSADYGVTFQTHGWQDVQLNNGV